MKLSRIVISAAALAAFALGPAARAEVSLREIETQFPECAGLFTQTDVDAIGRAAEDPEKAYKRWSQANFILTEEPPLTVCQSRIWRSLKGLVREAGSSREDEGSSLRGMFAASAKVGTSQPLAGGVYNYQGETFLAVSPKNPLHLVAGANTFDRGDASCKSPTGGSLTSGTQALFQSADGGKTWVHQCAPWHPAVIGGVSGAGNWFGSDPSLAWDADGNAYAAYMLLSQSNTALGTAIVIARSAGGQAPWTPWGVVVDNMKGGAINDKEMLAIDTTSGGAYSHPGRLYVIWDRANKVRVAYSDDGVTWVTKAVGSSVGRYKGGNLAIGADGTVYAVWNEIYAPDVNGKADPDRIWTSRSTDGGDTWSSPVLAFTLRRASFGTYYQPAAQDERPVTSITSIGIDRNPQSPFFGRLYLTWADATASCCPFNTFSQIDVYSSFSNDGGSTWAAPVRVNDDLQGQTHFNPWLSVDPTDGTVHVAWYDTRNDPNQEQTRVYTARSSQGGASWEPNLDFLAGGGTGFNNPVDYTNLNLWTNDFANPNQYGEYLGIAAAGRKVHAVWTDSRQFFPDPSLDDDIFWEDATLGTVTYCSIPNWFRGVPATPSVPGHATGSVALSWPGVFTWGVNATSGTYTVLRYAGAGCAGQPAVGATTGMAPATDTPPAAGTYSYRIRPKNNCPGTALTPMESLSACSSPVTFTP